MAQGQQVFAISWRNPDQEQGHFDLDTYAQAVARGARRGRRDHRSPTVHLAAACSGGIVTAGLLGHLAAAGRPGQGRQPHADGVRAGQRAGRGTVSALATRDVAAAAVAESARKGYVDGQALAGVFTWLRPNDLVWNYVVNNYLLGKDAAGVRHPVLEPGHGRLAAGLHRDFIHIALENSFTRPGALEVLGTPVDLGAVDVDVYVVAGLNDHIVPWENAYRSTQLFGGERALRALHAAATSRRSSTRPRAGGDRVELPRRRRRLRRRREACRGPGADAAGKLVARLGRVAGRTLRRACSRRRKRLGNRRFSAQAKAPGSYVLATADPRRISTAAGGRPLVGSAPGETRWQLELAGFSSTRYSADRRAARRRPPRRADARLWRRRPDAARAGHLAAPPRIPAAPCGFVANVSCSDRDRASRAAARLLHRRDGRRVALIGHSRGGHYSRAIGPRRPELVSHAISLGAGLRHMLAISYPDPVLRRRPPPAAAYRACALLAAA